MWTYRSLLAPARNGELTLNNHFEGMAWAIKNAAMMVTMTERDDIDVIVSNNALIPNGRTGEEVCLYIYDKYEGGLGTRRRSMTWCPRSWTPLFGWWEDVL